MDQLRLVRSPTRLRVALCATAVTVLAASCASGPSNGTPIAGGGVTNGVVTGGGTGGTTTGSGGTVGSTGGMSNAGTPAASGGNGGGAVQPMTGGGGSNPTGSMAGTGGTTVATGGAGAGAPTTGGAPANAGTGGAATTAGGAGAGGAGTEWWFDGPRPAPAIGTWPPPNIKLTEITGDAMQPTAIAAPRADTTRIFFTEKWGVIRLIKDGVLLPDPVLDMREAVLEGGPQGSNAGAELMNQGKRGLVGLAFHPNYAENGRAFVMYVADQGIPGYGTTDHANLYDDGDMTFAEYHRSDANPDVFDPEPVAVFLQFDKGNCDQCSQHNGGALDIDVDGFLWASTGDPPPYTNAGSQDLNDLNGKLLRFDISTSPPTEAGNYPEADPFVASIGIRNAYKFSVDRYTGDLYVGDVGESSWEEISVERYGEHNRNHGWPLVEGNQFFQAESCAGDNCLNPVFDYGHTGDEGDPGADNCIIGGYVYRGTAIPALQGAYFYGDNGSAKIRAIQVQDGAMTNGPHDFTNLSVFMSCFGEDAAGEMYVCDYNNGAILRIDPE